MPTLSEMRAKRDGPIPRPKKTVTVTLIEGQHLLEQIGRLSQEAEELMIAAVGTAAGDDERGTVPRKAAERTTPPRVDEIRREIPDLRTGLGQYQVEVGLTGLDGGEWQRFKEENPPRIVSRQETRRDNGDVVLGVPIYDAVDSTWARGFCDASALFEQLGRFVTDWDGDPIGPGEWDEFLAERVTYADRRDLVTEVVDLHEDRVKRVPKSPSGSSGMATGETASDSPAI